MSWALCGCARTGHFWRRSIKKAKQKFDIARGDIGPAQGGDFVLAQRLLNKSGARASKVRVLEVIGRLDDPGAVSMISLHEAGLETHFPDDVIAQTKDMRIPPLKAREDLRDTPLVTIDGADARDFDDAVFAEKEPDGAYHLIVAIADVAHYVKPGTALDRNARKRGNSTYFPDRVVPMLPETLSNDLCSLRPHEPRAALAVHMWIDGDGALLRYRFARALIKSAARLTYTQVQTARDGKPDDITAPLMDTVIRPLYEAYAVLDRARQKRGALDLDLPETSIIIENGQMSGVKTSDRLDSHRLIEEFMILANVAAACALEEKDGDIPHIYRVHEKPNQNKVADAGTFIKNFGLPFPKGKTVQPRDLNAVLRAAAQTDYSHLISKIILRTQSQAVYATKNIGHFGLALEKYTHFTSPIRRYADLLVHRALTGEYGEEDREQIDQICKHLSETERASTVAERNATDRFTAGYLSQHIGKEFEATINGVTRFGLFVTLKESGADGLVPMKTLRDDYYIHDEKAHALVGRKNGHVFRLGAAVRVVLKEADGLTGSSVFILAPGQTDADIPGIVPPAAVRGKRPRAAKKKKQ